jgi:hypothetical protein
MKLVPKRNWISIKMPEYNKKESEVVVLLPDDYNSKLSPYKAVLVVEDPQGEYAADSLIIVPTHIIHEVILESESFHLVERNFIMAQAE